MGNRFGSPTPKAGSGTEEEFNIAYENRENTHIMFFFKDAPTKPSLLDLKQFECVQSFKEKLSKQGVLYKVFSADFEKVFRQSLTQCLSKEYLDKDKGNNSDAIAMLPTRLKNDFKKYHDRMYEKYSIINTLVFHNTQRLLKEIYVAQSLVKEHLTDDDERRTKIDRLPVSLIKKHKKILITDTAGMGKSTMMKYMFIDLIDHGQEDVGIPIYIELNRLNKDRTILVEIQEELNSLSKEFDNDLLLSFIQKGGFIFFLDGFDEISIADRDEVIQDIKDFISKTSTGNYYIMTSRLEGRLSSFGDFQSFKIQPLTKDEAFELLSKYDLSKKKELSGKLVKLLQSGEYDSIDEFLENPLLVSLLFTAYDYNRSIPFEKHRFYGVVFEAYFEKHDLSKPLKSRNKFSGLNYDGFDMILRYIGYDCLIRTGVKFNKDTILNTIRAAKGFCGVSDFSENAFLEDLVSTVPIFCKEGTDYKWVHKSLLEYFAARFIFCDAKENQNNILSAIFNSENLDKYVNMLDLYYDIDLKGFSKNITLPFCERFIEIYDAHFNNLDLSKDLISARVSSLLFTKSALLVSSTKMSDAHLIFAKTDSKLSIFDYYRMPNADNERLYFAKKGVSNDCVLARLLYLKKSSIITNESVNYTDEYGNLTRNSFPKDISEFKHDTVYNIDIYTGNQSKELYQAINIIILWPFRNYIINGEACKKEAERIREEITQSNNTSVLLAGI